MTKKEFWHLSPKERYRVMREAKLTKAHLRIHERARKLRIAEYDRKLIAYKRELAHELSQCWVRGSIDRFQPAAASLDYLLPLLRHKRKPRLKKKKLHDSKNTLALNKKVWHHVSVA